MKSDFLSTSIEFLKGVGPKRAELLKKELNIHTFEDLLLHFPFRYIDRTKFYQVKDAHDELPYIQLKGRITHLQMTGPPKARRLTARFEDESGPMDLVWFKGIKWISQAIELNQRYVVFGKPSRFKNQFNIVHPEFELESDYQKNFLSSLQAVYPSTEKLNHQGLGSKGIWKLQRTMAHAFKGKIVESLPFQMLRDQALVAKEEALLNLHFPTDAQSLAKAQYRIKFEELFFIQLKLLQQKLINESKLNGYRFATIGNYFNGFYENKLPFELTNAQKKVLKEIRQDVNTGHQMNRLLQGDVGSGKTMVAAMSMLIALDNEYQACMMAPTEILANQHFASISHILEGLDIKVGLLTGSSKSSERKELHEQLRNGAMHILIGTHALIEESVQFKNLGMVVIDEQHRFGVAQRAKLWKKNNLPPHVLVMTATPIPRTLALTLYGDLDVSVIDELPAGRKPVKTIHRFDSSRLRVFGFLEKEIKKGRQVYIVYPLIKDSEKLDYKSLMDGYESIVRRFAPPEYSVSIVHGQMKAEDKEIEMQRFVSGKTHIMVATTVIEVGIDVPNASVMVIESAERFGLSQLHQLRGRVGRGADQSYCILMTGAKLSSEGKLRMETMVRTNDGFEVSEVDLKLRGPGDFQGTQQSGLPLGLKLANLSTDGPLLELCRSEAKRILKIDPDLAAEDHLPIRKQYARLMSATTNWGRIL